MPNTLGHSCLEQLGFDRQRGISQSRNQSSSRKRKLQEKDYSSDDEESYSFYKYKICLIVKQKILELTFNQSTYKDMSDGFTVFFCYAVGNPMLLTNGQRIFLYVY